MTIRCLLALLLAFCSALALIARAQDADDDAQIIEEDYRVTSVAERQLAVTNLLARADELRNSGQVVEAARTLNRVGRFQIRMSVPNEAVTTYQAALKLLKQQPDLRTQIDSLNGLASSYDWLSKCDLVESPAQEAITLGKQNNYVAGQAEGLLTLSDCQNHNDHELAFKTAQESLDLWRSINRKRGMAETYMVMAHYKLAQNNLPEATKYSEAALSLYAELSDVSEQTTALIYLGNIQFRLGALQDAMASYSRTQSMIDEKADPIKMGLIAGGLGEVFLESGSPEVALEKFREAREYFLLTKNQRSITATGWKIGQAQYLLGQYHEALATLQTTLREAESTNDSGLAAYCNDFLGSTYYALNDHAAALSHYQAALDGYSKAKNPMEAARTQALMGRVYQHQGAFRTARENYQAALTTFRLLADRVNQSATLFAMGNLELQENNLDTAEDYLQQSIEVTEQMRRISTSSDLTATFSATVHERYERYIECLMRQHQAHPNQGLALKAFQTSELARARSLTELLRATQTNLVPGLDPQLAEQEKSLRQSLRAKEDYKVAMLRRTYSQEELATLDAEVKRLEQDYQQLTQSIRQRYPAYEQMTRPSAWELPQIQKQVIADDQTVLLEYSLGTEKSYVWAVTRDNIKSYELPSQARINEAAQKVYRLLAAAGEAQNQNELNRAAQELSQMILLPVAAELNKQRVIVVADGALNYIPFQILPASSASDEPLVAKVEVVNTPSASILGQLREEHARRQAPTEVLAAFGDPVFASNYAERRESNKGEQIAAIQVPESERWQHALRDIEPAGDSFNPSAIQPLFYSKLELANLREVAGPESFVATGFDATREKLAGADLSKYAILHFATHGILNPKRPENSGLFLSMVNRDGQAENGFLGLQDIYRLHAPVDLVVLSACRTGLGKDVRGEGLIGLTRGFMYAGASSVVASLWKVDDEATSELMKRFYVNMLQRGLTPAAALREAQNSIRKEPQWSAPYYWAAFTLQGEHRQVVRRTTHGSRLSPTVVLSIIALGGLITIVSWWYFSRRVRRSTSG